MVSVAYWINPYGKIVSNGYKSHIQMIIDKPAKFGYTRDKIESIYKRYNEPMGKEGKAREDIIKDVVSKGFIRIRLYPNQYWSITAFQWNKKTRQALSVWAEIAKKVKQAGSYMKTKILTLKDDNLITKYDINDLYYALSEDFMPVLVDSIDQFEDIDSNLLTFEQWKKTRRIAA